MWNWYITASGEPLSIVDYVKTTVQVDSFKTEHEFVVVESLIYPVILGIDFLQHNELVLDFTTIPVSVCHSGKKLNLTPQIEAIWHSEKDVKSRRCAAAVIDDQSSNMINECSVPKYGDPLKFDQTSCNDADINRLLDEYKDLFRSIPGLTTLAHHYIPTASIPVRVPPEGSPSTTRRKSSIRLRKCYREGLLKKALDHGWPRQFLWRKNQVTSDCV